MKALGALFVALIIPAVFAPSAFADFGTPPPHTERVSTKVFRVDPSWWKTVKATGICPGAANDIEHHEQQKDGSTLVVCREDTFFDPEVPKVRNSTSGPTRYLTRTAVRTVKVPTDKVVTRIRTTPVVALTILYLVIGVISGIILGSVGTLLIKLRS